MSFQEGKIVGYLGDNKFVVQLPEEKKYNFNPEPDHIQVAHDYVRFFGSCSFEMERDENGNYPYKPKGGAANWVSSRGSVTIGIREMFDFVLPFLQKHKYLQPEHMKDRTYSEDDKYFEKYGLDKPRFKQGDKYPAYTYGAGIVYYYDDTTKTSMVAFRRTGESVWNYMDRSSFELVKDALQLSLSKDELAMRKKEAEEKTTKA